LFSGGADTWKKWGELSSTEKKYIGDQTQTILIYPDKLETHGFTFQKQ
jgi:hypothetical protein